MLETWADTVLLVIIYGVAIALVAGIAWGLYEVGRTLVAHARESRRNGMSWRWIILTQIWMVLGWIVGAIVMIVLVLLVAPFNPW